MSAASCWRWTRVPTTSEMKVVDAAYWMKGCSSLGKLRFAALVELKGGGRKTGYAMVDLKEAVAAAAPSAPGVRMPAHHGGARRRRAQALSPNLGDRMLAATMLDKPIVVRELMPPRSEAGDQPVLAA